MTYSRAKSTSNSNNYINGEIFFTIVGPIKDLGVFFYLILKFNSHINEN